MNTMFNPLKPLHFGSC